MAKLWKVVGVEAFKGEEYIKMEAVEPEKAFGKKHANISRTQVAALLEQYGVLELEQFAGVQSK